MANLYVIDGFGLAALAIIYHDKAKDHALYHLFDQNSSVTSKYLTTEASIMAAFSMVSALKKPRLVDALKRVVRYFFDETVMHFAIEHKTSARICQDYGDFVSNFGANYPPHILDSAFLAAEMYPGAIIVGKASTFYNQEGITVHAV